MKRQAFLMAVVLGGSPAWAAAPQQLSSKSGEASEITGIVSGGTTDRYELTVAKGVAARIHLSATDIGLCSLQILQMPLGVPFFRAGQGNAIYEAAGREARTLQIIAFPSRNAVISRAACEYTVSYQLTE